MKMKKILLIFMMVIVWASTSFAQNDIRQDKKRLIVQEKKGVGKETKREEAIKKQPEYIQGWIRKRLIFIGMTQEQVVLSLDEPRHINRTVTRRGVREQWVYERWDYKYLYFEDEVLIGWQQ